jgi:hypothetical protein
VPGTVPKKTSRSYRNATKANEATLRETNRTNEEQPEVKYARRSLLQDEGVKVSEAISFGWYYIKLRIRVVTGRHHTSHSLGIKYRWHNWQYWQRNKRS